MCSIDCSASEVLPTKIEWQRCLHDLEALMERKSGRRVQVARLCAWAHGSFDTTSSGEPSRDARRRGLLSVGRHLHSSCVRLITNCVRRAGWEPFRYGEEVYPIPHDYLTA